MEVIKVANILLRIDDELKEKIGNSATDNKRSLNSEILIAIEKYILNEKENDKNE